MAVLVPAPQAGDQDKFLAWDFVLNKPYWAEASNDKQFLCADGTFKFGNADNRFLRGDAKWDLMPLVSKTVMVVKDEPGGDYFLNNPGGFVSIYFRIANATTIPAKNVRFEVLVPGGFTFNYVTINGPGGYSYNPAPNVAVIDSIDDQNDYYCDAWIESDTVSDGSYPLTVNITGDNFDPISFELTLTVMWF